MTQFDQALKARATREDCPIPPALDGQVSAILNDLPRRNRSTRTLRPLRAALLAAALCLLCAASALALSPTLRERLTAALGGFQPYMQEIDGAVCVANGIEIRVVSAVADRYMTKVYAEVRDLEGNRLNADLSVWGLITRVEQGDAGQISGFTGGGKCVGFDEETGTALLEFHTWSNASDYLGEAQLSIFNLFLNSPTDQIGGEQHWTLDLDVEILDTRCVALNGAVDGAELVRADISALGTMLVTKGEAALGDGYLYSVYLEDGTVVHPQSQGGAADVEGGVGNTYLAFDDPVDPEQVTGISIHAWMIPLEGATAGEGYWLSELPQ
jgi:hypothetical protein